MDGLLTKSGHMSCCLLSTRRWRKHNTKTAQEIYQKEKVRFYMLISKMDTLVGVVPMHILASGPEVYFLIL